jgi:hypothetical protein
MVLVEIKETRTTSVKSFGRRSMVVSLRKRDDASSLLLVALVP